LTLGPATGQPIKVGAISTITGGPAFPESAQAAKAYFDWLNARGGINGRPVEYTSLDDAFNATTLAQDARQLVTQTGVVAMVGNASVLDCNTNEKYYEQQNIVVVGGAGITIQCYTSPNYAPTTAGLFVGLGVNFVYAVTVLGKKAPCMMAGAGNGNEDGVEAAIKAAEAKTGVTRKIANQYYPNQTGDWSPFLLKAKNAGCDVFIPAVAGPDLIALQKTEAALGLAQQMPIIELGSAYSSDTAAALKDVSDGLIATSDYLPFTAGGENLPGNAEWVGIMKAANLPLTTFGQCGYLAAKFFAKVVGGMTGDINPTTVSAAFRSMQPITDPMMGNPWVFGPGTKHQANYSSQYVQLKAGVWTPISTDWIQIQPAS
jgi:branched-chain amino acid transport system substrate-binding protein